MSEKERQASYAALVRQVVHDSPEPLPIAEIRRRIDQVRRIETRSPEATIRGAITQCWLMI